MRPPVEDLVDRLGIELHDPGAISQAFVHSSYFNENPLLAAGHNERLEFLGDAVVSLAVSDLLYRRHPGDDEGSLTARRAALVNREALAGIAVDLGLDRYLLLGRGEAEAGGGSRPSVLAAAFEALAGAVYLAAGAEVALAWLRRLFDERLRTGESAMAPKSAKSRLQEWTQRNQRLKPTYELLGTTGPAHDQRFTIAAA
ncbi:MAG: ribonuclease III, partial [Chloroflexota bacterium]|nr:ribonuclease III [Chloroflexota bacterium]